MTTFDRIQRVFQKGLKLDYQENRQRPGCRKITATHTLPVPLIHNSLCNSALSHLVRKCVIITCLSLL